MPTLEPTVEQETFIPTLAPVVALPPDSELKTYTDPEYGFSFDYPSNWYLIHLPPIESRGAGPNVVRIQNFVDDAYQKGGFTSDQFRIDIIIGRSNLFSNLDEWIRRFRDTNGVDPEAEITFTDIENLEVAGVPAARWTQTAYSIPQGEIVTGIMKGDRAFIMEAVPANSEQLDVLNLVTGSLRFQ